MERASDPQLPIARFMVMNAEQRLDFAEGGGIVSQAIFGRMTDSERRIFIAAGGELEREPGAPRGNPRQKR